MLGDVAAALNACSEGLQIVLLWTWRVRSLETQKGEPVTHGMRRVVQEMRRVVQEMRNEQGDS
jgi:hypothetical protein